MTDTQDTNGEQHEAPRSRSRAFALARLGFAAAAFVFLTGSTRSCDDGRPPTITCQDVTLRVEPGTCASFSNPCDASGIWAGAPAYDGFRFEPSEDIEALFGTNPPFSVHTTRVERETTRSICVNADSPLFPSLDVDFLYGLGVEYGTGSVFLTIAPPLTVEVAASPTNLALGETSQLVAIAHGGIRPYFYAWVPTTGLDDSDIAAPIASPPSTTQYRVRVTDSGGQEMVVGVTISVGAELTVTANPPEIRLGDVSVLLALPQGGTPPFTFTWTPTDALDDPHSLNPSATPATTTTYHVTALDSAGVATSGSATVTVSLEVAATAEPLEIVAGETSALFAEARGGTPPYTFTWTSADTLDDPSRQDPIAAPTMATTYQVIARDSAGATMADSVTVQVVGDDPPPTASFVFGVQCCPSIVVDASASTGRIVSYAWDLGWTSASPDRITSSPTTSFIIREFDRGPITLTVTADDGRTATTTQNF